MTSAAQNPRDPLVVLPTELSFQIISHLPARSVASCSSVSKTWNKFLKAHADALWQDLLFRDYRSDGCIEKGARHATWKDACKNPGRIKLWLGADFAVIQTRAIMRRKNVVTRAFAEAARSVS